MKDRLRIHSLLPQVDKAKLANLLERFDDEEGALAKSSMAYARRSYEAKERWHARQSKLSFGSKLAILDSLLKSGKETPKVC